MNATAYDPAGTPLYFDHQASTPVDPAVVEAMKPYFTEWCANPHSAEHAPARIAHRAIDAARAAVASCIGCEAEDVIFTSGATESNNLGILGVANTGPGKRDIILVSAIEHASVLEAARASGLLVRQIPVDSSGRVIVEEFDALLNDRVRLVSVGFVNNEIGIIQDLAQLGEHVQAAGALFHVDGAQALTALSMSVHELPIDFLSLSSHKAYGPKGVGALYIAPGRHKALRPLLYGGGQERGLRAGTLPTPLCVGFGAACDLIQRHGEVERREVRARRDYLFAELKRRVPAAFLNGPAEARHPGNLSLRLPITDARDLVQVLQEHLACSTGSACHSGSELPSHVLIAIGLSVAHARQVVRLSIGRFTSDRDCELAAELLARALESCESAGGVDCN